MWRYMHQGVLPAEVQARLHAAEKGRPELPAKILRQHLRLQTPNHRPLFLLCGIKLDTIVEAQQILCVPECHVRYTVSQ
jgi:hypothetical protein